MVVINIPTTTETVINQSKVITTTEISQEIPVEVIPWTFETLLPYLAKKYGQDEALARRIIACESHNDPYAVGNNYSEEGILWSKDIGYWQINNYFHKETALQRTYDIYKWEENLEYGFIMLKEKGTQPWSASKHCWDT